MVKSIVTSKSGLAGNAGPAAHEAKPKADSNSAFTGAAIGMSWQMAVIVLLPIVGGYKLDQKTGLMPWLTLAGVLVAIAGSIFVIRRALQAFNNFTPYSADSAAMTADYDAEDDA